MKTNLVEKKVVTPYVAKHFGEPHNDYLYFLSSFGIFGLIGLLFMYLAPSFVFFREICIGKYFIARNFAAIGAMTCVSFAIFGVPETLFRNMRTMSFYAVVLMYALTLMDQYKFKGSKEITN